jgi:pimeloyl-ACP methyl ester carboxylesterase
MKDTFLRVIQDDLTHLLSNIKTRTFIIWGNKDKTLNVNLTKRFKRHIENSTVKIIWGAGHNPQIDKPTELVNILKECLYAK